jgi:hypothetical protein
MTGSSKNRDGPHHHPKIPQVPVQIQVGISGRSHEGLGTSTNDLVSILRWQLFIGPRSLLSLPLIWNRDVQGKERRGDRDC